MRKIIFTVFFICLILTSCSYDRKITAENISISPVYSSGMVLQTSPVTIINGKADPGGILAVRIKNYVKLVQTNTDGDWLAKFPEIILKEPFSISIEGKDTSITFNNIRAGRIIIIAGDGNLPVLSSREYISRNPQSNRDIRIFSSRIRGNHYQNDGFKNGKWFQPDEVMNSQKSSQLLSEIIQILPDSKIPIGIIDLLWPGSQIESWLPAKGKSHMNGLNIDPAFIDSVLLMNETSDRKIWAMNDTCKEAYKAGATKVWYNDELWRETDLPVILGLKGNVQKNRVIFLRKKIYVSSKYLSSDFYINLAHINGIAQFYFNETQIDPHVIAPGKSQLIIPDSLMRVWSNVLTVRLFCADSLCGFYGDEFIIHNADSSYYKSIDKEWKYSLSLEPEFPSLYPVEEIQGLAFNSLMSPVTNINAESIVFLFRNRTLYQTHQPEKKVCEIFSSLPETWQKTIAYNSLSFEDSLIYGINSNTLDSIYQGIRINCGFEIEEIKTKNSALNKQSFQ